MISFEGKSVLIVGASTGIGAAAARLFSRLGASLVLASRNVPLTETLAADLTRALVIECDVATDGAVEQAVELAVRAHGGLDIVFNNAGMQGPALPLHEQTARDFDRIIDVNLKGVWRSMKAEIPALLDRGSGSIVNTASVGGIVAAPGISPYCASKHGVVGLSKAAALDYAPTIRINVVAPGAVDTAMFNEWMSDRAERDKMISRHPFGRAGYPEEVAGTVAFLCSDAAAYTTGAVVPVDGGYTVT